MNIENLSDIPQPDPEWDYYPLWHSLQHIKAKIDAALKVMNKQEYANSVTDVEMREILDLASDKLIEIVNSLEHDEEE
ncbi:hypothetical protein [Nostoc sp. 2RC]|uniref:hypothetical protein n=1 Tax=Nostoc sp. 2RC TaxID=2485484 RepID=UPI00162915DE|nr:hypothetical protein [Nostoc sp. 2RC]MBC1242199.1 hypothetical protein [Nostoc sp. 2RC]